MDKSVWYNTREGNNGHENFGPYYNCHYNKTGVSYVDTFHSNPYDNAPTSMSVIEIGAIPSSEEKEVNTKSIIKNVNPKKSCKIEKLKKCKNRKKKDSDINYPDREGDKCQPRPLKPAPCRGQAKHSECDKVSDDSRALIYGEFRSLSNSQAQWQFIASHVYVHAKSRSTSKGPSRREKTHQYFLTVCGEQVKVCRKFFLATLNVSEAMIRTALDKLSLQGICLDDSRGRKTPSNKLSADDEEIVRKHILSFPPVESTQSKKKSTKKYLDPSLSVATMHKMYVNNCTNVNRKPVSVETYRRICKEYNIHFIKSRKDQSKKVTTSVKRKKDDELNSSKNKVSLQIWNKDERMDGNILKNSKTGFHHNEELQPSKLHQPSYASYVCGNEYCTREYIGKANTYVAAVEEISSLEPSASTHNTNFANNYLPNKIVTEIGGVTFSNEKGDKVISATGAPIQKKNYKNENLKRNRTRLRRLQGECYVDSKGVARPARPMKPVTCRGQVKHSECDKVSEENRSLIYSEFRKLGSSQAQWQFIATHVYVHAKNRCTSQGPSRRENTHQYFLTVCGEKVKVCRKFFLATLNVSEAMIRTALYKLSPQGICLDDNRGRKTPSNKLSKEDEEFLRAHINSFRSVDSSYFGKKNSKKYLDPNLSVAGMHKMYINICREEHRKPVSVETYRRICKEYNISFEKFQKDHKNIFTSHFWDRDGGMKDITLTPLKENEIIINREQENVVSKTNPEEPMILDFDLHTLLYMPEGS